MSVGKAVLRTASQVCAVVGIALLIIAVLDAVAMLLLLALIGAGLGSKSWLPWGVSLWGYSAFAGLLVSSAGWPTWPRRSEVCVIADLSLLGGLFIYLIIGTLIGGP